LKEDKMKSNSCVLSKILGGVKLVSGRTYVITTKSLPPDRKATIDKLLPPGTSLVRRVVLSRPATSPEMIRIFT